LSADERGKHLPEFLVEMARCLNDEQRANLEELSRVVKGVEHIKHVIHLQQTHAKKRTVLEDADPASLVEAALQLQMDSMSRHHVAVERRVTPMPPMPLDRHRILQILMNLLSNAKDAVRSM